jgi:hypothetical protein
MNWLQNQPPDGLGTAVSGSEPDPAIVADEEALARIRSLCAVAKASAEEVPQAIDSDLARINRLRFTSARRMSLELAKSISDPAYRDVALVYIIELCVTADDMEVSRILLQGIQSEPIRQELVEAYPTLLR